MEAPAPELQARIARLLGAKPVRWRRALSGGYTPSARWVVHTGAGASFVKIATEATTAGLLRKEAAVYASVTGDFMPRFLGFEDDAAAPMMAIADLSDARWPPPWEPEDVASILAAARRMHATPCELPTYAERHGHRPAGWATVAAAPAPFLSVSHIPADWLAANLPALIAAEEECETGGEALTHLDLRSDNVCFVDGRPVFIDWAEACCGNPKLDVGFWLPSLTFEGGPLPDEILPNEPTIAAWVAGFFARQAGLPNIPHAPFVRRVQREQLSTALPWAISALRLPNP